MARPSNSEVRRSQITTALLRVMARRGYDGASIGDIARAARLAPGLVHYHFENKREILLALLSELARRHDERLEARLASAADSRAALTAFIDTHLRLGAEADPEALACWVLLGGEALRDAKVRRAFAAVLERATTQLTAIIDAGVRQGVFACDSPRASAAALIATIQGYFVVAATARSLIPAGSAADSTLRMAEALLTSRRRPPSATKQTRTRR